MRVLGWVGAWWITIAGTITVSDLLYKYLSMGTLFYSLRNFTACVVSILPGLIILALGLYWMKFLRKKK